MLNNEQITTTTIITTMLASEQLISLQKDEVLFATKDQILSAEHTLTEFAKEYSESDPVFSWECLKAWAHIAEFRDVGIPLHDLIFLLEDTTGVLLKDSTEMLDCVVSDGGDQVVNNYPVAV
jgi:hypothetical protein